MAKSKSKPKRRYSPLPLSQVSIEDGFWAPRQKVNREKSIAYQFAQLERIGAIEALDVQPRPLKMTFRPSGVNYQMFWDSDIAKWLEAACYSLTTHPDPELEAQVEEIIAGLAKAQQKDGYLNTYFTAHDPNNRFSNERDLHETYCAGHLIEAAVAHFQATGRRSLLEVMERYVTLLSKVYGPGKNQKHGYPGHQEIELALLKLFRVTGKKEHLEFARYLIDERGKQPYFFDIEARARGDDPARYYHVTHQYSQSHKPVRGQDKVVGHAVRAMYLYTAMADIAAEIGDSELLEACERLWADLTSKRLYVTGGLGPSATNEGFTNDYDLPNESAYAETCASIGLVFWSNQMLSVTGEGRYADMMEHALYNNVLAGVALKGETYFYDNVLQSRGDHHRWGWHRCPCCPPNVLRLLASLGQYAYGQGKDEVAVHLYIQGKASFKVGRRTVTLQQTTNYPWDGDIRIGLELAKPTKFALRLRIPAWCPSAKLWVNGKAVKAKADQGYVVLNREWNPGDEVRLELAMPIERVRAHPAVRANVGLVALKRGPMVYCLEATDNPHPLHQIVLADANLQPRFEPELLGGVTVLQGQARVENPDKWGHDLYKSERPSLGKTSIRAVPYCVWDNREAGEMRVWIRGS